MVLPFRAGPLCKSSRIFASVSTNTEPREADLPHTTTPAARKANISEATLRMWARLGLVPFKTTASGMRLFQLADVLRVARERAARRAR
jgi:hypothetical protein